MGILTGSAIALGLLIVVLGIPELASGPALEAPPTMPATEMPSVASSAVAEVLRKEPDSSAPQQAAEPAASHLSEPEPEATIAPPVAITEAVAPITEPLPAVATGWFAFWSPFRSELAATGFVSELQRTTGLDYRVVKLKPGVYEVAFAYSDENDIQDKLTRISAATGLDLSGG
jgi:hypothetical protein